VTEDHLYEQLRERLRDDFVAVKPLKVAWKRALWIFPISLLFMEFTLAVFHLRGDHVNLGPLVLWGFYLLQLLACYLVFAVSLETCIPGSLKAPVALATIGLIGPAIYFIASWVTFRISPHRPNPGQEWSTGIACLSAIGMFGIIALLFGFFLARAGLPIRARAAGILLGLMSGLAGEAVWRLHCPVSSWDHILLYHSGAIFVLVAAAFAVGYFWKRKVLHT